MIKRTLAGLEVSALALGGANFGGLGSARRLIGQGNSEAEVHALLDCGFALGITLIDTAGSYADGASESMIGRWLKTRSPAEREGVRVASKVGLRGGLSAGNIKMEIERSLDRLGIGSLDYYLAHVPDPETPWPLVMDTMARLKEIGLIRAFGLSNVSREDIRACAVTDERPTFIQNRFNLLDQADTETDVMEACRQEGLAYTCYSPLAGGLLSGAYSYAAAVREGSRLALRPDLYAHLWEPGIGARIEALKSIAESWGLSLPGLAVWWLAHHPKVTTVMLGARTPRQLERLVCEAVDFPFDAALFNAADQASRNGK